MKTTIDKLQNCINMIQIISLDQFGNLDKVSLLEKEIKLINKELKAMQIEKPYTLSQIWNITSKTGNSWEAMEEKLKKVKEHLESK